MNTPSKKHHYVPRFLLRNFYNKETTLFVFDKLNEKIFPSNAIDSGHENNFNTVELGNETINFEEIFNDSDNDGAKIIGKLINSTYTWDLSSIEKEKLAIFVAAQFLRTKMPRKQIEKLNSSLTSWIESTPYGETNKEGYLKRLSLEEIKLLSLLSLEDIEEYKQYILDRDIVVIRTTSEDPFYISDNPVKLYSSKADKYAGLKVSGTHIYFPIAPTMLLCFMCKTSYSIAISNIHYFRNKKLEIPKDLKSIYLAIAEKKISMATSENVEFYNHLQVKNSSRFIYSSKDDFKLAREMILSNPSIKEGSPVLTVGGNFYPDLPNGEIAVISLTEEKSRTIEIINIPAEFNIAILLKDKYEFEKIASIEEGFYGIEIFQDRQLVRGMKNIRICKIKSEEQIIEFEHSDPSINLIMNFVKEKTKKKEAAEKSPL